MRMFTLYRSDDETGISGTGTVAEGIEFSDGRVAIRWCVGDNKSTTLFDTIESVEVIHGHGGKTTVQWADEAGADESEHVLEMHDWCAHDFEMRWDEENVFPFIEDEDAYGIYGWGHHDKALFAALVNRYDLVSAGLDPEDCTYTAGDVKHLYAVPHPGNPEERFTWKIDGRPVTVDDENAFALTLLTR
jgi:hypothetical protein